MMPMSLISFLTSALARTIFDLPYSVALNSKTLASSPSSHLRIGLFSYVAKFSRNDMSTLEQFFRVTLDKGKQYVAVVTLNPAIPGRDWYA